MVLKDAFNRKIIDAKKRTKSQILDYDPFPVKNYFIYSARKKDEHFLRDSKLSFRFFCGIVNFLLDFFAG